MRRFKDLSLFWVSALTVGFGLAASYLSILVLAYLTRSSGAKPWEWVPSRNTPEERAALFDVVKIGLSMVAGVGAAVALVVAYRKQAHAESDLSGMREARAGAIAQLGDRSATVRLAGAYALAAVADRWPSERELVVRVLCGHLRLPYSPADPTNGVREITQQVSMPHSAWGEPPRAITARITSDPGEHEVRRTITALLVHRTVPHGPWSGIPLDLQGAFMEGANLIEAHLKKADLEDISLSHAFLMGAHLEAADLGRANLTDARLTRANLTLADLFGAQLMEAWMIGADLTGASLSEADLTGAHLTAATLTGADLSKADFTGAEVDQEALDVARNVDKALNLDKAIITPRRPASTQP